MAGIKVTITTEPGDKKATIRMTHTSAEEGQDPEVMDVKIGATAVETPRSFELQLNGKLTLEVVEVVEMVYDPAQALVTEKPKDPDPMMAEASREAASKGPKSESAKEESGASSARSRATHK